MCETAERQTVLKWAVCCNNQRFSLMSCCRSSVSYQFEFPISIAVLITLLITIWFPPCNLCWCESVSLLCLSHRSSCLHFPPPHTVIIPAQKYFTMFIVGLVFRSAMSVFFHPLCESVFLHSVFNLIPFPALLEFCSFLLGNSFGFIPTMPEALILFCWQ